MVRYEYESGGSYYITTIGFGNGHLGWLNEAMADWVWGGNTRDIARAAIYADSHSGSVSGFLSSPVPDFVTAAKTPWNAAFTESSPLVLDLTATHTGIALTSFNASTTTTFFDIDNSGYATQTAWVGADMGLLCRDLNSNGRIDNAGELFGSSTVDGFALLSTLDSNGDHRIDQYDSAWSTLKIWVDANGDAVTQDGELHTLGSLNVASIDLAAVASSTSTISGNPISHTSFFTFTSGATATVADAWFVHDTTNSYYSGDYTLDVDTLLLPTLRGFGTLPDLAIAESQDSTLKGIVSDLASSFDMTTSFANGASLDSAITDIMYRWAGVDGVAPNSRGGSFDAQKLEFLEEFFGKNYVQIPKANSPNPTGFAVGELQDSWDATFYNEKAALLTQAGADSIFGGTVSYNPATGAFEGDKLLSQDAIDALQLAAPTTSTADTQHYWEQVAQYIGVVKGFENLTTTENTMMNDAILATDASLSWSGIEETALPRVFGYQVQGGPDDDNLTGTAYADNIDGGAGNDHIIGGGGNDTLHGGDGNDIITNSASGPSYLYGDAGDDELHAGTGGDHLYGGDGNDLLYGGAGADVLDAGAGGNIVYGKGGDDTYVYSGGADVYNEYTGGGTDTILLPSGITSGDLAISRINTTSLLITVGNIGSIEIESFFGSNGHTISSIETVTFSDATTLNLSSFTSLPTYGSDGADVLNGVYNTQDRDNTIYGYGGNDVITTGGGADYIDGGAGNDVMIGGAGNDTYAASPGYDKITDTVGALDTILMPAGITDEDVHLLRHSNSATTLEVTIDGLGQIDVLYQFSGGGGMEQIKFSDNSTIDLTAHIVESVGTTGNDTINGILSGASINDIIDGREGNDALYGGAGNDIYVFSTGHDTISDTAGTDVLNFGDAWSPGDISIYRDAGTTNLMFVDGDGNSAKILSQYYSSAYSVETAHFADGTSWNLLTMQIETHGTSGADNISAVSVGNQDDIIYGYDGNDTIHGGDGNDMLYGGNGNDTLYGQGGDDTVYGGDGNDTLYGDYTGSGADTFVFKSGDAGIDTIADFSTAQGDKIDIHDILVGYDPLTSAITDFVHITASGSNAILSVDANGTAGGASFTQIATLSGLSSLAGHENDLLTNGNLIAHAA